MINTLFYAAHHFCGGSTLHSFKSLEARDSFLKKSSHNVPVTSSEASGSYYSKCKVVAHRK